MRLEDLGHAFRAILMLGGGPIAWALTAPGATAADGTACRAELAGTYLATIESAKGRYASRALVTIHGDGTFSVVDSRQYQGVQGSSFSAQQGSYRCLDPRTGKGRTLNFGFPKRASIARSDWQIVKEQPNGLILGTVTLIIYSGVKGVDPFAAKGGKRIGTYRFVGQPVMPPAK